MPGKKDVKPVWEIMKLLNTDDFMQLDFYVCNVCNMIYSKAYNALKHKLCTHPTQNFLKCLMCSYQAVDGNHFFNHLTEHNITKVICPILSCQSSFSLEENFYLHIEKSHKIKCEICGEIFERKVAYRTHKYKMHVTECAECKMTFDKPIDCMTHRQRAHDRGKDITSIACKVCGKEFKRRVHYATHLRIHFDYLRLPCKVCQKTFQTQQGLTNHMRVHTQEKTFLCNICGKSFAQESSFSAHMKKEREKAVKSKTRNQL